jgi:hypothetical protein
MRRRENKRAYVVTAGLLIAFIVAAALLVLCSVPAEQLQQQEIDMVYGATQ